jgi:hypothetical protein
VSEGYTNSVSYRLKRLEEDVQDLKAGQPAVIAERVRMLSLRVAELKTEIQGDMEELRGELATQRKILIGSFVSLALGLITAYVLGGGGVPA